MVSICRNGANWLDLSKKCCGKVTLHNIQNTHFPLWNMVVAASCWWDHLCSRQGIWWEVVGRWMELEQMFFLQDFLNMLRLYHISEEQASKVVLAKWKTQSKNEIVGISWSSVVEKMASNAHQHFFCLFLHDSKAFPFTPLYVFTLHLLF